MRLVTYDDGSGPKPGKIVGNHVCDLSLALGVPSLRNLLEQGRLPDAEKVATGGVELAEVKLCVPIPDPAKIICVGVNYVDRNAEYRDGSAPPQYPSLFMRTPLSFTAPGGSLLIPRESEQLDYEGEIALVVGKSGRRIGRDDAHRHIAGLTIMNEGSVRDWIKHGKFNVTQGKNFDRSGSFGPWIETNLPPLEAIHIETRVNGEVRQADTTANMAFPIRGIIAYVSTFTTLVPGDIIATGTPSGSGGRFDPPRWLRAGDTVEVTVEGIGTLTNGVAHE